uniref:Flavodoxin-like domain-containing protein n=1 Tax=Emiliania huxleyi TaxID=2903 RepID=A0A6V2VAJ9_EMIHU
MPDSPARVLVVYGSEGGNARRAITKCVRAWERECDGSYAVERVVAGCELDCPVDELASRYEVLIVATSSFGEGDPPENYLPFLLGLLRAKEAAARGGGGGGPPLRGLQHAVLGFGQSVFATYQNCPRWTDKLLGELGSRRFVRRVEAEEALPPLRAPLAHVSPSPPQVEVDEANDEAPADEGGDYFGSGGAGSVRDVGALPEGALDPDAGLERRRGVDRFRFEVQWALTHARDTAGEPPVCGWGSPGSELTERCEAELLEARPEVVRDSALLAGPLLRLLLAGAAAAAAAAAAAGYELRLAW